MYYFPVQDCIYTRRNVGTEMRTTVREGGEPRGVLMLTACVKWAFACASMMYVERCPGWTVNSLVRSAGTCSVQTLTIGTSNKY